MRRWLLLPLMAAAFAADQFLAAHGPKHLAGVPPRQTAGAGPAVTSTGVKILVCWLVFLAWCGTTDWVSRDAQEHRTNYLRWNPILFGSFAGALLLHLLLPWFWLGFPLLVIAYVGPLAAYVIVRNRKVGRRRARADPRSSAALALRARQARGVEDCREEARSPRGRTSDNPHRGGGHRARRQRPLLSARQSPGFTNTRALLADALFRRADAIMLDYTQQGVGVKHMVDGVWHESAARDRELGDPLLATLKLLSGLNPEDRQSRQEGRFAAQYASEKYAAMIVTQGSPTGERVLVQLEGRKVRFDSLEALGMRSKMEEQVREIMARQQGFFLISAMPAGGLRSTTSVIIRSSDRFMREFYAVEEAANRYEEVENVRVTTYKAAEGQTPATVLPEVLFQDPNVVVVRDLVNGETVSLLCDAIPKNRLIVSTIRAKDGAEALLRVLALKVPPAEFARGITAVLNQRLIRKLCPRCKEAYRPHAGHVAEAGDSRGQGGGLLPPAAASGGRGETRDLPRVYRHRLRRSHGDLRAFAGRRHGPQDPGRQPQAGPAPPGGPQGGHEEPSGRRDRVGGQGRHVVGGVDARTEAVKMSC